MKYFASMQEKIVIWALRVGVALLPLTLGAALESWLDSNITHDLPVIMAAWVTWAAMLLATLVPHTLSRTLAHIGAVAVVALTLALPDARTNPLDIFNALVVFALVSLPPMNMWWINGTAYPNERRFMLRMPSLLTFGPLAFAYIITIGTPVAAILLFGNGKLLWGAAMVALGIIPVLLCARAIHQLGRRWIVFVPAGVVLHDPMSLTDPVLFQRGVIEKFAPALADTDALDLTQSALGMSIELDLTEKVPMVLAKPMGAVEAGASARLMFTPSHPGEVLAEAARRKLPH